MKFLFLNLLKKNSDEKKAKLKDCKKIQNILINPSFKKITRKKSLKKTIDPNLANNCNNLNLHMISIFFILLIAIIFFKYFYFKYFLALL